MEQKKEMSKESRQALLELHETRMEEKNEIKKRILERILYLLIFIILFKVIIGILYLPGFVPMKDRRMYDMSFNGIKPVAPFTVTKTIPIIPTFIESRGFWENSFSLDRQLYLKIPLEDNEKVYLDVYSYGCETTLDGKRYDMECQENKKLDFIPKNDLKYKLLIRSDYGKVYYDGEYIRDITDYLSTKEYRVVIVTGKYLFTEAEISAHVKLVKSK